MRYRESILPHPRFTTGCTRYPRAREWIALGLLMGMLCFCQETLGQRVRTTYDHALALIHSGDFLRGCAEAKQVLRNDPNFYAAYNLMGVCLTGEGQLQVAASLFRKSLALNPGFIDARVNLALNLLQRGSPNAARRELQRVLELQPNNVSALYDLGRVDLRTGAYDLAIRHLRRASDLMPDNPKITMTLATALIAAKKPLRAAHLLQLLIARQRNFHVVLSAAIVALEAGQNKLASEGLGKALRLNSGADAEVMNIAREASRNGNYKLVSELLTAFGTRGKDLAEWNALLGYADYKLGRPAVALDHLQRAIGLDPNQEDYYMKLGELTLYYNSDKVAVTVFKAALERFPSSALLHFGLAVAYWSHENNLAAARQQVDEALSIEPNLQPALNLLCRIEYRTKEWRELRTAAKRLIQLNSNSPDGYYYDGVAVAEGNLEGDPGTSSDRAEHLLEEALKSDPRDADANVALGKLFLEHGKLASAITEFKHATMADIRNSEAYYNLAMAYQRAGRQKESAAALKEFSQLKGQERQGWEGLFQVAQ